MLTAFTKWMAEPLKGSISIQHQTQAVPVSKIGPSLDILLRSAYKVTDVPGCTGLNPYDDVVLNKAFSLPTSSALFLSSTRSAVVTTMPTSRQIISAIFSNTVSPSPATTSRTVSSVRTISQTRSTATRISVPSSIPRSYNLSYFPRGDVIPPIDPSLTAALLSGYSIPDLPPRGPNQGVDWSRT